MTPVTVLTGFLGSGKTTLLARLLRTPSFARTAVIINEFGEIGIDHDLVTASEESFIQLETGCLCCEVRGDLEATIAELITRRAAGSVPPFERIVIETSGAADPAPVLAAIMAETGRDGAVVLEGIVTCVDAVTGVSTLDREPQAARQIAVADRLILTKTDLLTAADPTLLTRIRRLNPLAALHIAIQGEIDPDLLTGPPAEQPSPESFNSLVENENLPVRPAQASPSDTSPSPPSSPHPASPLPYSSPLEGEVAEGRCGRARHTSTDPSPLTQFAIPVRLAEASPTNTCPSPPSSPHPASPLPFSSPLEGEVAEGRWGGAPHAKPREATSPIPHDPALSCITIRHEAPIPALVLPLLIEALADHLGPDLLRFKAIIHVAERPEGPAVLHGVQHLFHEPEWRPAWPSADRTSRLVLIGRNLSALWVECLLEALVAEVAELA